MNMNNQDIGKILVTGGGGFIGSKISDYLISKGFDVLSVSRKDCDCVIRNLSISYFQKILYREL